ncbi:hypothetical protein ES703_122075 [subsurface metagenome]
MHLVQGNRNRGRGGVGIFIYIRIEFIHGNSGSPGSSFDDPDVRLVGHDVLYSIQFQSVVIKDNLNSLNNNPNCEIIDLSAIHLDEEVLGVRFMGDHRITAASGGSLYKNTECPDQDYHCLRK